MHSVGNWSYYAGLSKTWLHIRHDDAVKGRSGSKDISPKHVDSAAYGGEYAPPRVFEALGFDFFIPIRTRWLLVTPALQHMSSIAQDASSMSSDRDD